MAPGQWCELAMEGETVEGLELRARELLRQFKGDSYRFGLGAIEQAGELGTRIGERFLLVRGRSCEGNGMLEGLKAAFV
ncbi:MAG: hypothetical protein PVJ27_11330, partial [Candidatus Brocadiaceae bacterium]